MSVQLPASVMVSAKVKGTFFWWKLDVCEMPGIIEKKRYFNCKGQIKGTHIRLGSYKKDHWELERETIAYSY